MKFKSEKEREELISLFEEKAKELTAKLSNEIPKGTSVIFETITEYGEEIETEELDDNGKKIVNQTGDIYVAYIKQPHLMTAVQVLDKLNKKDLFSAGLMAWDSMIISSHSSKEVEDYRIKLGLLSRVALVLDGQRPDIKKK